MALSDREKDVIIQHLEDMEDRARRIVIASLDAFIEWIRSVLYSIYLKIKDVIRSIWNWISSVF